MTPNYVNVFNKTPNDDVWAYGRPTGRGCNLLRYCRPATRKVRRHNYALPDDVIVNDVIRRRPSKGDCLEGPSVQAAINGRIVKQLIQRRRQTTGRSLRRRG